jgi:hypothetical protein
MDNNIDEILAILQAAHKKGVYTGYAENEAKAALLKAFREEWLRMIGEDKPELSVGNGFEGGFEAAYRVKVQNQLRAELRRKLVEGEK